MGLVQFLDDEVLTRFGEDGFRESERALQIARDAIRGNILQMSPDWCINAY